MHPGANCQRNTKMTELKIGRPRDSRDIGPHIGKQWQQHDDNVADCNEPQGVYCTTFVYLRMVPPSQFFSVL